MRINLYEMSEYFSAVYNLINLRILVTYATVQFSSRPHNELLWKLFFFAKFDNALHNLQEQMCQISKIFKRTTPNLAAIIGATPSGGNISNRSEGVLAVNCEVRFLISSCLTPYIHLNKLYLIATSHLPQQTNQPCSNYAERCQPEVVFPPPQECHSLRIAARLPLCVTEDEPIQP